MIGIDVIGDLREMMEAEAQAGERAVSGGIAAAAKGLQGDWRAEIVRSGLGRRLSQSIRSARYPDREPSINAAALVWSKAPEIIGAHASGVVVRSAGGFWLAIPTPAAGKLARGKRPTPGEWEARNGLRLRFIYRGSSRPSLLVAEARVDARGRARASRSKTGRNVATVPIFVLVRQARLPKRLNLDRPAERWLARLPGLIVDAWRETA